MASLTMTASFLAVAGARPSSVNRRKFASTKPTVCSQKAVMPTSNIEEPKEEKESNTRRGVMLAAAAAIWAAGSALPEMAAVAEEPKRGTPEAKKKYFPVCVTMPTARICYK